VAAVPGPVGVVDRPAMLPGRSVSSPSAASGGGGQVVGVGGGPQSRANISFRRSRRARLPRGVGVSLCLEDAIRAGTVISLRRDRRGGCPGQEAGQGRSGAGQLERDHGQHQSGRVSCEMPAWALGRSWAAYHAQAVGHDRGHSSSSRPCSVMLRVHHASARGVVRSQTTKPGRGAGDHRDWPRLGVTQFVKPGRHMPRVPMI
jgi:hypothetical protein